MRHKVLTFDIGGKSIKYTIFSNNKQVFKPKNVKLNKTNKSNVLAIMKQIYSEHKKLINAVAISAPGAIDKKGIVYGPTAIRNFDNFNLKEEIKKLFQFKGPIAVINDGNAAAYADYSTVPPQSTIVTIAVGSGVGGGIIANGELLFGNNGFSGEMGLTLTSISWQNQKIMTCSETSGFYNLEAYYKSLSGVAKAGKSIFKLYDCKDKYAVQAVNRMYNGLAATIFNIFALVDPNYIFIGGGLANRTKAANEITSFVTNLQKDLKFNFKIGKIRNSSFLAHSQLWGCYKFFLNSNSENKASN